MGCSVLLADSNICYAATSRIKYNASDVTDLAALPIDPSNQLKDVVWKTKLDYYVYLALTNRSNLMMSNDHHSHRIISYAHLKWLQASC